MLSWDSLDNFKKAGFLSGYPTNLKRFFAPEDDVHGALAAVVKSAKLSIACAMFGWDDDEIDELFREALINEGLPVQVALDKTQAAGKHEREILAKWPVHIIGNNVVIGQSSKHAISHLKLFVIDGIYTVGGSTNLSDSGEKKQNNELIVFRDPVYAAETRAKIDLVHDEMARQMSGKK